MTYCNEQLMLFPGVKGKKVEAQFKGGDITSDGGALLLRMVDQKFNLTRRIAKTLPDDRDPSKTKHSILKLLRQRVYGLALGYEDLNDQDQLRHDPGFQTILETDASAGSSPTLCRFENSMTREACVSMSSLLVEHFIKAIGKPKGPLILDFDATDDRTHGKQEGYFFHGYYDHYCFLPLYVFCGEHLLTAYLRPSNIDGAKHTWAILSLLVKRVRQAWPDVEIIFRGDSGFCRHRMFNWCEKHGVGYITGLAKNKRLEKQALELRQQAEYLYLITDKKQRRFAEYQYSAKSWKCKRRVIAKAEHSFRGENNRFVVTNLEGDPQELYDRLYCQRGKMEQSIDEQISFFSDRTSCTKWYPNQFRLLLSSFAYVLVNEIRSLGLSGTELAKARCATIRLKLLKIGAIIIRNTRRIRFLLAENHPFKELFLTAYHRLKPG